MSGLVKRTLGFNAPVAINGSSNFLMLEAYLNIVRYCGIRTR